MSSLSRMAILSFKQRLLHFNGMKQLIIVFFKPNRHIQIVVILYHLKQMLEKIQP